MVVRVKLIAALCIAAFMAGAPVHAKKDQVASDESVAMKPAKHKVQKLKSVAPVPAQAGLEVRGNTSPLAQRRNMTAVLAEESCAVVVEDNHFPGAAQIDNVVPYSC